MYEKSFEWGEFTFLLLAWLSGARILMELGS